MFDITNSLGDSCYHLAALYPFITDRNAGRNDSEFLSSDLSRKGQKAHYNAGYSGTYLEYQSSGNRGCLLCGLDVSLVYIAISSPATPKWWEPIFKKLTL